MPFKPLEKVIRRGSAFVKLKDGFTGEAVALPVKVWVKSVGGSPAAPGDVDFITKTPGEYGFVDLASGTYEIRWESQYFFPPDNDSPETFTRKAGEDYKEPKVVALRPKPSYPFPDGATLLRGVVVAADDTPAERATVVIVERSESTASTDARGEFVIVFADLRRSETASENDLYKDKDGTYYVVPKGGSEADIELTARATLGTSSGEVKVRVLAEKVNMLGLDEEGKPKRIRLS
jgi:hypothetical protein